jgi:hypothetical protein
MIRYIKDGLDVDTLMYKKNPSTDHYYGESHCFIDGDAGLAGLTYNQSRSGCHNGKRTCTHRKRPCMNNKS